MASQEVQACPDLLRRGPVLPTICMHYAYVLQNPDGILYKGHTNDLIKRIDQHNKNNGFHSYTKKKGPWKLVYKEEFLTREDAKMREKFYKTGKGREFLKAIISLG